MNPTASTPSVWDIVLAPFPFTDLATAFPRPALVLATTTHGDLIVAFITSRSQPTSPLNIVLDPEHEDFAGTGLKALSTIRLERLVTIAPTIVISRLGVLGRGSRPQVSAGLRALFNL